MTVEGRRRLFSPEARPVLARAEGRHALFSPPAGVTVHCSRCGVSTRLDPLAALRRMAVGGWVPGRSYGRRIRCPACRRRSWCRVRWRSEGA